MKNIIYTPGNSETVQTRIGQINTLPGVFLSNTFSHGKC